jgi:hypothetical protein
MTLLKIKIERDAHDDYDYIVMEESDEKDMCCDNCGRDLHGSTILATFHRRAEMMIYLTAKIKQESR